MKVGILVGGKIDDVDYIALAEQLGYNRLATMNLDNAKRAEVSREVTTALQAYVDGDGIAIPTAAHLVMARV